MILGWEKWFKALLTIPEMLCLSQIGIWARQSSHTADSNASRNNQSRFCLPAIHRGGSLIGIQATHFIRGS